MEDEEDVVVGDEMEPNFDKEVAGENLVSLSKITLLRPIRQGFALMLTARLET